VLRRASNSDLCRWRAAAESNHQWPTKPARSGDLTLLEVGMVQASDTVNGDSGCGTSHAWPLHAASPAGEPKQGGNHQGSQGSGALASRPWSRA
jgi:hypothetical protein